MPNEKDYIDKMYDYVGTLDGTYKTDVSLDKFKEKMADEKYAKSIYDWVGENDKTFHTDVPFESFTEKLGLKKNLVSNQTSSKPISFGSELPYATTAKTLPQSPLVSTKTISQSKLPLPLSPKELVSKIKDYAAQPNIAVEDDPETSDYVTRLGDRAIRGMNQLNANIARVPEFIYNVAAMPQNIAAQALDIPELAVSAEKVKADLGITNEVAQYYDNEVKALAYLDQKYQGQNQSIVNLVEKGSYKDAAKLLGEQIAESLPTTAAIIASGGLGATPTAITLAGGGVFGASKMEELKDRTDLTDAEKTSISLSTGLVEGLFENIGTANLGRVAKDIFVKEGAENAAKALKQTFIDTYKEALKKYMPISGVISEGLEEAGTQFAQNAIDIYGGVDHNKKMTDGVMDAFIVGAGSGGVISSPTLLSKKRNDKVEKKQSEIETLGADIANENVPIEVKNELVKARQQKMEEVNAILEEDTQEQKALPDEAKREIEGLTENKIVLQQSLATDMSDESKNLVVKRIDEIDKQIETIVNENTKKTADTKAEQPTVTEDTGLSDQPTSLSTATEEVRKPTPNKVKVLGEEVNMYNDYIPSKAEDVEPAAMYSFNSDSKEGIPSLLHDIAYTNKREVNGVKTENWHASISGEELLKLYPKETKAEVSLQPEGESKLKVETVKQGKKGALANLDPQTQEDFIAIKLNSSRVKPESLVAKMGKAHLTKQMRLSYLSNKGTSINQIAKDLIDEGGVFENMDEQVVEQMVADFIINHPAGARQYANKNVEAKDALHQRYDEEAAWAEAEANRLAEEQQDEFYSASENAMQAIDAMSDEEYNALVEQFDKRQILEDELLNLIENGKQTETTTAGQKPVEKTSSKTDSSESKPTKTESKTVTEFEAKMAEAKEALKPELEKAGISYKQAIFTVNKYGREVKEDEAISEKDLKSALKNKAEGKTREGYEPKKVKKTVVTKRAYEGEFREEVKAELEKQGLTREVENQVEANESAKKFVESVGEDAALEAVRSGDVVGGTAAAIFANVMIKNREAALLSEDEAVIEEANKREAELIEEFGQLAKQGGQFNSMINFIYQNTDLGFNVEAKINEYKEANGGVIPADVEAKFRELDKELKEVNKKLAEAEKRATEAEANAAVKNIQESVKRSKTRNYTQRSKDVADSIRKLKNKPFKFTDENGNEIDIQTMGVSWNDLVETIAKAVEKGGKVIDAINEAVKNSDFYKKLSDKDKNRLIVQLQEYFAESEKTEGELKISKSTIRDFVEGGITDINELTQAVYDLISPAYPNLTLRQVRDEITGYGKVANLSQDEISRQIRKIKDIGRILSSLEDVANKIRPLKIGMQRDKMDAEQRSLRKQLREAMKDLPQDLETTEADLKTQLDAAKNRMRNQIEDLQKEIDSKVKTPENIRTLKEDEELKELKEKRDKLKSEHDAIFKDEEFIEAKRLEQTKQRTQKRIEDLQRRLKEGDFSKTTRKAVVADTELTKLRADKLRIQDEYNKELYKVKLKNRTKAEKAKDAAWELWNIPRVLMATGEASFVLVQGLKQTIAHPLTAIRAAKNAIKFMSSEKETEKWLNEIKSQEWYPILKGSKLALTEPNAELTAREELFYSGWTNIVWDSLGWFVTYPYRGKSKGAHLKAFEAWSKANPFRAVERASVGYLDTMRVERFLDGMQMLEMKGKSFEKDKQDYKDVADAINTMTGRASLGKYGELAAPALAKVFFSPRNWASGIKTATPYALYHFGTMTPTARKMAISDFSKFLGLTTSMVMMAAAYLNNDDDEETSVEMDPRSSDFMKIKLGKKRIDPWGGMQQQVVLSARLMADALMKLFPQIGIRGAIKKDNEILPLGVPNRTKTAIGLMSQQAINKLNPTASLIYNYSDTHYDSDGKLVNDFGEEYTLSNEMSEKFNPIFWNTVSDLMKDDPNAINGLLSFYAFFGGGVSVYDDKKGKYKVGEVETEVSQTAKDIQSKISAVKKEESAVEKAEKLIEREESDIELKITDAEKELRKLVESKKDRKASIIITELEKLPAMDREDVFDRWNTIGIVPDELYSTIEVSPSGEINMVK